MAPVKEALQSIVRLSSQDPIHRAENILARSDNKWLSHKADRSGRIEVEIHLSKAIRIGFVNIGNAGSAFIELLVGSSMWPAGTNYKTLLPSTVLMSPQDSKNGKNTQCVKMLNEDVFCNKVTDQEWDRVQVICRQPYTKEKQFGLQFIHFVAKDKPTTPERQKDVDSQQQTLSKFKSMLSPTTTRHNLVKKSPGSSLASPSPSRAAGLVQAALKGKPSPKNTLKETPTRRRITSNKPKSSPYSVNGSASQQRGKTISRSSAGDIEDEVECFLEGCKFEDMPLAVLERITFRDLKDKMEKQRGCGLNKMEKKIFLKLAEKAVAKVTKDFHDEVEEREKKKPESEDGHCMRTETIDLSLQDLCSSSSGTSRPTTSEPITIIEDEISHIPSVDTSHMDDIGHESILVPCPICNKRFPESRIIVHANVCAELNFDLPPEISAFS